MACTEAEAMVRAAEAKTDIRPWRRTDLLAQRLAQAEAERQRWEAKTTQAEQALAQAKTALEETRQQLQDWQDKVAQLEIEYKERQRPERPHSRLAQARAKVVSTCGVRYGEKSRWRKPGRICNASKLIWISAWLTCTNWSAA